MASLAVLQRRFYELVTAGGGTVEPGLVSDPARLGIYAEMYAARLHDVLADDYPKLRTALGEAAFQDVVAEFLRCRPPTSFTLRDAGQALAGYLREYAAIPPWAVDLATLERARVEVFDGPDTTALAREDLISIPVERFPALVLRWIPSSEIIELRWAVDELWTAIEDGAPTVEPERCNRSVLVWRRDLRVFHRTLDDDEAPLAVHVARNATIAELSAMLADRGVPAPDHRIVELLTRWLDAGTVAQ